MRNSWAVSKQPQMTDRGFAVRGSKVPSYQGTGVSLGLRGKERDDWELLT